MSDLTSIFDHVLANRCAYIGNEIPEGLANDTRAKTVYIGIPADLIGEIQDAHDAELAQLRTELARLRPLAEAAVALSETVPTDRRAHGTEIDDREYAEERLKDVARRVGGELARAQAQAGEGA